MWCGLVTTAVPLWAQSFGQGAVKPSESFAQSGRICIGTAALHCATQNHLHNDTPLTCATTAKSRAGIRLKLCGLVSLMHGHKMMLTPYSCASLSSVTIYTYHIHHDAGYADAC
eukprot:13860-Heterococcus_DN1.PRE.1